MFRIQRNGKFVDEYSYEHFEQACWVYDKTPGTEVVEVDAYGKGTAVRRFTADECQQQLRRSPAPR